MDIAKQSRQILVVDDSALARKLVEHTLLRDAYSVLLAESGQEALELFEKHRPALVITDWLMPGFSGVELCGRIRAESRGPYTHIILLTGVSDKAELVKALRAGADDYLTKPFHPEELLARVEVGCRSVDLHREVEMKNLLLEQLALTDSLTGLPNRRAIEDWAARQCSGAVRHRYQSWLVMADLDNFKLINDNHGHGAGDEVLRKTAEIFRENTRQCDMCARAGGEEFLMFLSHVEREGVQTAVERIREKIAAQRFEFGGSEAKVTASFGIASLSNGEALDFGRLLERTDQALYSAKRLGRNRVEFAAPETLQPASGN
jgi:two-component system, cell cycle response regulator